MITFKTKDELKSFIELPDHPPLARIIEDGCGGYQGQFLSDHSNGVSSLAAKLCTVEIYRKTVGLFAKYHDPGKVRKIWQEYMILSVLGEWKRGKIPHSTFGGKVLLQCEEIPEEWREMGACLVWMHHGIENILQRKKRIVHIKETKGLNITSDDESFVSVLGQIQQEIEADQQSLFPEFPDRYLPGKLNRKEMFYQRGMLFRYFLSLLIDADWLDSGNFGNGNPVEISTVTPDWIRLQSRLDEFMEKTSFRKTKVNRVRQVIADQCFASATSQPQFFRLDVPTGGGKTLSSLRFALEQARQTGAEHIFYIAPYNSILDQNYAVYRQIFMEGDVLLHHSGVFQEVTGEDSYGKKDALQELEESDASSLAVRAATENWVGPPIILTSAVQFMNSIFSTRKQSIRRFHSLANSVIILDEIQSFPSKIIHMLTGALNFMVDELNSTIVLCTATQPDWENLEYPLRGPITKMVNLSEEQEEVFHRTEMKDLGEIDIQDLCERVKKDFTEDQKSGMVICNTKKICRMVYQAAVEEMGRENVYHLSTNMYPKHRKEVLEEVTQRLKRNEKLVLITTSIVEAGVDISFQNVYREMAGLENAVQAAGRCNREGLETLGEVFIFRLRETNLSRLREIKVRREAFEDARIEDSRIREGSNKPDSTVINPSDISRLYYQKLNKFLAPSQEYSYPVNNKDNKYICNRVFHMLSDSNKPGNYGFLQQCFSDAGEEYRYIEDYGTDVVVETDESLEICARLKDRPGFERSRELIRSLQNYTIQIPKNLFGKLSEEIQPNAIGNLEMYILSRQKYNADFGFDPENEEWDPLIV